MWANGGASARDTDTLTALAVATQRTIDYVIEIDGGDADASTRHRAQAALHAGDHLERLLARLIEDERLATVAGDDELRAMAEPLAELVRVERGWLAGGRSDPTTMARLVAERLAARMEPFRAAEIERAVVAEADTEAVTDRLDAARWLGRVAAHLWRVSYHLDELAGTRHVESAA
ncbi:MAG: hypothetical protein KDB37_06115 [Ilumatobacter sp.]|nr:hypothetical protein [Ilumatobacter sp.]